jgi:FkbM family methyltransferase
MNSAPTLSVYCGGRQFEVTAMQREFWESVSAGNWETDTFRLFDHCITPETVHLDIGTWIGPTLLYAAGVAGCSLGFEPDPAAYRILEANVGLNPHLKPIRIFPVAISPSHGESSMGSRSEAGDSMSSLLFANSNESWHVKLRRIEEFEPYWPVGSPVFLKIDIEGGEYQLMPYLTDFVRRHRPTIYVSYHPQFFMAPYLGRGKCRQAIGELILFWRTLRAMRTYREFEYIYDASGGRFSHGTLLSRHCWRSSRGLVFSNQPIPYLEHPSGSALPD